MKPIFCILCLSFPFLLAAKPCGPGPFVVLGIEIKPVDISCIGMTDGAIRLALVNANAPVDYQWSGPGISGIGQLTSVDPIDILADLLQGSYNFTLTDAFGHDTVVQTLILEPAAFQGTLVPLSDYSGYAVSCFDSQDGIGKAVVTGGTPPYSYFWPNGQTNQIIDSLPAGPCQIAVLDANYCPFVLNGSLSAPPPMVSTLKAQGDKCLGQNSGAVEITSISGGVSPYQVVFDNHPPVAQTLWTNLAPGNYFLTILDANGCRKEEGAVLPTGLELKINVGADSSMYTGDTLLYQLTSNRPLSSTSWSPEQYTMVINPDQALLFPYSSTTYTVTAVDTSGCVAIDQVHITVHRNRSVYIPNVFEPEAVATENQTFTLFGSAGIDEVEILQVFDRFGRLWFENSHFPVNQPDAGWNGNGGSDKALPGVYLYQAIVRFSDGRTETYIGDVTLVR